MTRQDHKIVAPALLFREQEPEIDLKLADSTISGLTARPSLTQELKIIIHMLITRVSGYV